MARKTHLPTYGFHKATGQARCYVKGKSVYLGEYGSAESHAEFGKLISRLAAGLPVEQSVSEADEQTPPDTGPSVAEVILAFTTHAKKHYQKNAQQTSEVFCFNTCLRILRELYGLTPAKDFGPLALQAVRTKMINGDPHAKRADGTPTPRKPWARRNTNRMIGRIRQVFKHAVSIEMVDVSVLQRLQTLAPLSRNADGARDNPKRQAVDQERIDAVRPFVSQLVNDLIDLQLLTGARSGELLMLTPNIINRTGEVWKTVLPDHKCFHLGLTRTLYFGPKAKVIVEKYDSGDPLKPLFKITRPGYCRAVTRACASATVDRWTPHWLRHTYITRTREQFGRDAAQAIAGHSSSDQTLEYSSKMDKLATQTAAAIG